MIKIIGNIFEKLQEQAEKQQKIEKDKINHEGIRNNFIPHFKEFFPKYREIIQERFQKLGAPENFLGEKNEIQENVFSYENGGIYKKEWIEDDIKYTEMQNIDIFKKEKSFTRDGFFAEEITPFILNKFFIESDYIILNTSSYDDNNNGIDHIIFNIRTGKAICALDEFVDNKEATFIKDERFNKKQEKIRHKIIKYGGGRIKYGAIFKDYKFQKLAYLKNLPFAILRVERKSLYKSMKDMDFSNYKKISEAEKNLVKGTLYSLKKQINYFSSFTKEGVYESLQELINFLEEKVEN